MNAKNIEKGKIYGLRSFPLPTTLEKNYFINFTTLTSEEISAFILPFISI
jgi:hypothetical protein